MGRKLTLGGLLLVAIASYGFTENKFIIYPGRGVANVQLQSLQDTVNKNLGSVKPSEISKVMADPSARTFQMWLSYSDLGLTFIYDGQSRRLESIVVMNPLYNVLGSDLKVGDRASKIPDSWGQPARGMQNADLAKLTFPRRGIEFWIDSSDSIFAVVVMAPR